MSAAEKNTPKRYYRKRIELTRILDKIKLWPSRRGILHGIQSVRLRGDGISIVTHCNEILLVNNSRNSRAARWLRNRWFTKTCDKCSVPDWKIEKYNSTHFNRHYGSDLSHPKVSEPN